MKNELIEKVTKDFKSAVDFFKHELNSLQVGRANSSLVDGLMVSAYGVPTPLKNMSSVSIPDSKTIQIQPWDRGLLSEIEVAIQKSELGLTPMNDGMSIRLTIPDLTQDRRIALKKVVHEKAEEARISLRTARQKVHNEFKKMKETSEITEDDFFSLDKELQKVLVEYTDSVDTILKEKEADIISI